MKLSNYTYYQIDKGMRKIIKILNEKNYITEVCCEGHLKHPQDKKDRWLAYIGFKKEYNFQIPVPTYYNIIEKKRIGKQKEGYYYNINNRYFYWVGFKKGSAEEKERDRINFLKVLTFWAESLPYIEID